METAVISVKDRQQARLVDPSAARRLRGRHAVELSDQHPGRVLAPGLVMGNAIVWAPAPDDVRLRHQAGGVPRAGGPADGRGEPRDGTRARSSGTRSLRIRYGGGRVHRQPGDRQESGGGRAGKPMLLELGGNGPTVVLDDADVTRAAAESLRLLLQRRPGLFGNRADHRLRRSRTRHCWRGCRRGQELPAGKPALAADTTLGPLNNQGVAEKTCRHMEDSQARGAVVLVGGRRAADFGSSLFFEPTVIDRVTRANADRAGGDIRPGRAGDGGGVGRGNPGAREQLLRPRRLGLDARHEARIPVRGEATHRHRQHQRDERYWEPHIPFGGMSGKRSGIGRIGGRHSLEAMSDLKTIVLDLS